MFIEWVLLPVMAALLLFGMFALQEVGRRTAPQPPPAGDDGTGTVVAAVFTLLGLLLAFQFNSAAYRLESRRALLLQEANAIGTAYLRLDLLAPEDREPLRERFRRYTDARIGAYHAIPDFEESRRHARDAVQLQGEIWTATVAACDRKPVAGLNVLLFPALNAMFDITTTRDAGTLTHNSYVVGMFLIGVSLLTALLAGRTMVRAPQRPTFHMAIFAILVSATVLIIFDLEYPRIGFLRIGVVDQAMTILRTSMQ